MHFLKEEREEKNKITTNNKLFIRRRHMSFHEKKSTAKLSMIRYNDKFGHRKRPHVPFKWHRRSEPINTWTTHTHNFLNLKIN
jgi:hypothetical protein